MTTTLIRSCTVVNFDFSERVDVLIENVSCTVISRGRDTHGQGDMRAKASDGDLVARKPNARVHEANAIWKGVSARKGVERIEVVQ